jgi:hypothetical protein
MNEARKKPNRPSKVCPSMGGEVSLKMAGFSLAYFSSLFFIFFKELF